MGKKITKLGSKSALACCIMVFVAFLSVFAVNARGIEMSKLTLEQQDTLVYKTAFYFEVDEGEFYQRMNYQEITNLIMWVKANNRSRIDIFGWTDYSGDSRLNQRLSERRARTAASYLVKEGVYSGYIATHGMGVDHNENKAEARRAEIIAYIPVEKDDYRLGENAILDDEEDNFEPQEPQETKEEPQEEPKQEVIEESVVVLAAAEEDDSYLYAGAGVGVVFGRSTFSSISMNGRKPGINAYLMGGFNLNPVLSTEITLGYTSLEMFGYDCCRDLYYADGNRYFAPVAGLKNYSYNDLTSNTKIYTIDAKLNIDMVGIWNQDSKWSMLVSPKIGVGFSYAKALYEGTVLNSKHDAHLLLGGELAGQYDINSTWGLRLRSGVDYLGGSGIDAMPQMEHKTNYLWTTSLGLILKF